jgi:hypothetical protein
MQQKMNECCKRYLNNRQFWNLLVPNDISICPQCATRWSMKFGMWFKLGEEHEPKSE